MIAYPPSAEHAADTTAEQVNAVAPHGPPPTGRSFGERLGACEGVATADSLEPAAIADTVLSAHRSSIVKTAEAATKSLPDAAEVLEATRKVPQPTEDPVAELAMRKGLGFNAGSGSTEKMFSSTGKEIKGMGDNGDGSGKAVHGLVSHAIQNAAENAEGTAQALQHNADECDDAKQPVTEAEVDVTRAEDFNAQEWHAVQCEGTVSEIAPKTWSEVVMGSVAAVSQVAQQTVGLAVEKVSGSRGNGGTQAARNGDSLHAEG